MPVEISGTKYFKNFISPTNLFFFQIWGINGLCTHITTWTHPYSSLVAPFRRNFGTSSGGSSFSGWPVQKDLRLEPLNQPRTLTAFPVLVFTMACHPTEEYERRIRKKSWNFNILEQWRYKQKVKINTVKVYEIMQFLHTKNDKNQ